MKFLLSSNRTIISIFKFLVVVLESSMVANRSGKHPLTDGVLVMVALAAEINVLNFLPNFNPGKLLNQINFYDSLVIRFNFSCQWRFDWFLNADNPSFTFVPVTCPTAITDKSGCIRTA